MLINPHHPYNYTFHLGQAYFILRRYDEAIAAFQQGVATNPAAERLHVWLAAAYAQYGEIDEAEWEGVAQGGVIQIKGIRSANCFLGADAMAKFKVFS